MVEAMNAFTPVFSLNEKRIERGMVVLSELARKGLRRASMKRGLKEEWWKIYASGQPTSLNEKRIESLIAIQNPLS